MREVELIVVGGGPAGVSAALTAREFGVETVLIDENPIDPAYVQRNIPKWYGTRDAGRTLSSQTVYRWFSSHPKLQAAAEAGAEVLTQQSAWGASSDRIVGVFDGSETQLLQARQIVLATGTTDLHLAFPGWTRSGVLGAGGALNLLDTYGFLTGRRMIILGSGDLGLALAERAIQAGIEVAGIVELRQQVQGNREVAAELARNGIPFFLGCMILEAEGGAEVERVRLAELDGSGACTDRVKSIDADTLCVAIGLQPAIELAYLAGCAMSFDRAGGGYYPSHDASLRTSQEGFLVAGDLTGALDGNVRRPEQAESSGRLAALTAVEALGRLEYGVAEQLKQEARARVGINLAPPRSLNVSDGAFLTPWHRLADSLAEDSLVVCRCEEVTRGEVLAAIEMAGCDIPDEVKRVSRAGMGLCQGRGCRPLVAGILAQRGERSIEDLPIGSYRPPVRPLPLAALATEEQRAIPVLLPFEDLEARLRRDIATGELRPMALSHFHWRAERIAYSLAEDGASAEEVQRVVADLERQLRYGAPRR